MSPNGTGRTMTIATAVVAVVLVVLTAVAVLTVSSIRTSQHELERLTATVTVWRDLQLAVGEEAFAEAGYRRAPSDQARARLEAAIAAVPERVAQTRAVGNARDAATLDRLTVLNGRYVAAVRRTLDTPPAPGTTDRVAGPALDSMSTELAGAVQGHRDRAAQKRAEQATRTDLMLWVVPSGTLAGALTLGFCWFTLVRAHRRLMVDADDSARRAARDPLTGLANREALRGAFEARRAAGGEIALMLVDLDHFKEVNDTLGHQAGDALLEAVAGQMAALVRDGDVVARIGGDEFAVLLTADGGVRRVAEAVIAAVADLAIAYDVGVGASVGTARRPVDGDTYEELVAAADTALYVAKRAGRGRVHHALQGPREERVLTR